MKSISSGVKKLKPTTNGQRHRIVNLFEDLTFKKNKPKKSLIDKNINKKSRGIDNKGRRRGRQKLGHPKLYRIINFKRDVYDTLGTVKSIEYDPNRSANIALVFYSTLKKYEYIIATQNLKRDDKVYSYNLDNNIRIENSNSMLLKYVPIGTVISNVSYTPNCETFAVRSAGSFGKVLSKTSHKKNYIQIEMPSGEIRLFHENCRVTIGRIGNLSHNLIQHGKASIKRYLGWKPYVRGVAQNAYDHKHGGGKNKSPIGNKKGPMSATGKPTLGYKTRNNKRTDTFIIKRKNS